MVIGADSWAQTVEEMMAAQHTIAAATQGMRDRVATRFTLERYIATMPKCMRLHHPHHFRRFYSPMRTYATIAAVLCLLCACTTPPGISVTTVDVVEVGKTANQIAIRIQLSNPTKVPIRIDTWNYSVRVREEQVYSGQWVAAITIPPESRLLTAIHLYQLGLSHFFQSSQVDWAIFPFEI